MVFGRQQVGLVNFAFLWVWNVSVGGSQGISIWAQTEWSVNFYIWISQILFKKSNLNALAILVWSKYVQWHSIVVTEISGERKFYSRYILQPFSNYRQNYLDLNFGRFSEENMGNFGIYRLINIALEIKWKVIHNLWIKVTLIMISAATSHQGRFASALLWSCPNVGQDQSHYEQAVNLERSIYSSHMAQNYLIFIFVYQILISCSMFLNHHEPMWIEIRMMGQSQLPNTTPAVTTSGATLKSRVRSSTDFAKRARLTGHTSPKIRSTFLKTRSMSPKTRSTFPKIRSMSPKTSSTFPTNRSQCKLVSQPTQLENLAGGFPSSWALIGFIWFQSFELGQCGIFVNYILQDRLTSMWIRTGDRGRPHLHFGHRLLECGGVPHILQDPRWAGPFGFVWILIWIF